MRDYGKRYFSDNSAKGWRLAQKTLEFLRRSYDARPRAGALEVSLRFAETGANLALTLRGALDRRFFRRAGRRLEKLLRRSATTVTLYIEELREGQRHHLDLLLKRLARYGDRVSIRVSEKIRPMLAINSSVFHLVLDETSA